MVTRSQSKAAVLNSKSVNCSKCEEICEDKPKVKDRQTIECDCCSFYFHIGCVNVVEGKLQATEEYNLKWYCPFCEKAAESLAKKVVALERDFERVNSELEAVKAELKNEKIARVLTNDRLEQYQRKDSIRISGIPHVIGETNAQLEDKVITVANKIGVNLVRGDISVTHRLKKDKNGNLPTIVKFATRRSKEAVFGAKKNLKGQTDMQEVYIAEDLTAIRFSTLMQAKACKDFKSVSTKNGRIYVWRNNVENPDKPVMLESPFDLKKLDLEPNIDVLRLDTKY